MEVTEATEDTGQTEEQRKDKKIIFIGTLACKRKEQKKTPHLPKEMWGGRFNDICA